MTTPEITQADRKLAERYWPNPPHWVLNMLSEARTQARGAALEEAASKLDEYRRILFDGTARNSGQLATILHHVASAYECAAQIVRNLRYEGGQNDHA